MNRYTMMIKRAKLIGKLKKLDYKLYGEVSTTLIELERLFKQELKDLLDSKGSL